MFAHDTERALAGAVALVNTGRQTDERLPDVSALDAFVEEWGWTGYLYSARDSSWACTSAPSIAPQG